MQTQSDFIQLCIEATKLSNAQLKLCKIVKQLFQLSATMRNEILSIDSEESFPAIYESPTLEIRMFTMPPYYKTCPHEHGVWSIVGVLEGKEKNLHYRETKNGLAVSKIDEVNELEYITMNKNTIHSVYNNSTNITRSLHIYGGNLSENRQYFWEPFALEKLAYDREKYIALSQQITTNRNKHHPKNH